jgi:hypothetical protein
LITSEGFIPISISRFSVGFGCTGEFEVLPQAATFPEEEETTGELWN